MDVAHSIKIKSVPKKDDFHTPQNTLQPNIRCSFTGKPANYYVGLSQSKEEASIKIVGSVRSEFVEMAINKLLGQGHGDIKWPVILNLDKELIYNSYDAHCKGLSAIFGWQEHCKKYESNL